ncbi:unnamed protein product [Vicia faba]|uniref:Uncharacterized protein n=1 Tax=Vicia faba TaxID=3906 RepID=A0AAV1B0H2_VICFA|nr:unnamed protein product [Vicia faba]
MRNTPSYIVHPRLRHYSSLFNSSLSLIQLLINLSSISTSVCAAQRARIAMQMSSQLDLLTSDDVEKGEHIKDLGIYGLPTREKFEASSIGSEDGKSEENIEDWMCALKFWLQIVEYDDISLQIPDEVSMKLR